MLGEFGHAVKYALAEDAAILVALLLMLPFAVIQAETYLSSSDHISTITAIPCAPTPALQQRALVLPPAPKADMRYLHIPQTLLAKLSFVFPGENMTTGRA